MWRPRLIVNQLLTQCITIMNPLTSFIFVNPIINPKPFPLLIKSPSYSYRTPLLTLSPLLTSEIGWFDPGTGQWRLAEFHWCLWNGGV